MAKNLQGGCLCGAVRYQITTGAGVEGSDLAGTYCHCSMCRRTSGGGYAMLFDNPRSALSWTKGAPTIYQSSPVAKRGFRRACGSPLFYERGCAFHDCRKLGRVFDLQARPPLWHRKPTSLGGLWAQSSWPGK
jgi:hypothetical protein